MVKQVPLATKSENHNLLKWDVETSVMNAASRAEDEVESLKGENEYEDERRGQTVSGTIITSG